MAESEHFAEFRPESASEHFEDHSHHLLLTGTSITQEVPSKCADLPNFRTARPSDTVDRVSEIRVLIADDEQLMRSALAIFVERSSTMQVVGTAEDGATAVELAERLRPDVVLMDLNMPGVDGFEAAQRLQDAGNGARILAITTLGTTDAIVRALRGGFAGYLLKDSPPEAVVAAVAAVHSGSGALSPEVTRRLILDVKSDATTPAVLVRELNERESAILRELARGKSNQEIAETLHQAESTVKTHLGAVMKKWNARDRVQVLIIAVKAGLVEL